MPTEGMGEPASEFLLRMTVNRNLRPADKAKMREVAYLFIAHIETIKQLREENERLVWQINNPDDANEEIPF